MPPWAYKKMSKDEYAWFIWILILLLLIFMLSLFMFIHSLLSYLNPSQCSEKSSRTSRREVTGRQYSIPLPQQERASFKYSCIGALVSKHAILTASPCGQNMKALYLGGKFTKIRSTSGTHMFNVQYQNYTLIESDDLQLRLLKVSVDLTEYGLEVLGLPSLNYSVVYRGSGTIMYQDEYGIKSAVVSFIHPYYCHLVYERSKHVIDFNLMICAVSDLKKSDKFCLKNAIGSPLIQNGILVGLLTASKMDSCGEIKRPLVFINIIPYLQWFETHSIRYL
ncbi:hypothetical protein ILUMI_07865 [Ignelater luminosus]|uniref:Peptidase S1 domain-containing protein n=1 Tax=Ignelater luminosus TaxID=2038154 RepID=A0A8K0D8K9_IGNLU|nr:hypothetical protein ILUMI_07865 [Ignelater luminosus]